MQINPKYFIFAVIRVLILQTILIATPISAMKRAWKLKSVYTYLLSYMHDHVSQEHVIMNRNGRMFVNEKKRKFERPLCGLFGVLIVRFYPEIPGAFLLNTAVALLAIFELLTQRTEKLIVKFQVTNAETNSISLTDENAKTVYELTNYYKRIKEPACYYRGHKLDDGRIKTIHPPTSIN
ncbi:hypothetical protein M3Y96_00990400 [Aphelenchoides besseyi]|nr:hypothetical protein M3Y96_00990400 [Aphelenchoides besseyi]